MSLSPIIPPCHPLPFPPFPSLFPFVLHSLLLLHIYWVFILLHSLIPPLLPIPPTLLLPTYPPPSLSSTSYIIILLLLCSLSLLILIFVFSFILRFFFSFSYHISPPVCLCSSAFLLCGLTFSCLFPSPYPPSFSTLSSFSSIYCSFSFSLFSFFYPTSLTLLPI